MRLILSTAAGLALVLAASAPAEAAVGTKKKYKVAKRAYYERPYRVEHPGGHNLTEPSSWRVGSTEWWRAMNYQGRAGRRF